MPTSCYRELAPAFALRSELVCLWTQAIGPGEGAYPQRVLPDGCIDLVWIGGAPPVVVGPATRPFTAELPGGTLIIGVRFHPGRAPRLLRTPASALCDREVPLADLDGTAASLTDQLASAGPASRRLAVLQEALALRVGRARAADELVTYGVLWLAGRPRGRVRELGQQLGVSGRQLQRRFVEAVGYGPKTLQRILRLQRLLALAGTGGPSRPLATLALEAGYADQAHMSRELAEFGGTTATRLLATAGTALGMSDLFKNEPDLLATLLV